jgi:hypothetical protein
MMIFDGNPGCAISVFVLSESVCGRVRQSRTRRQKSGLRRSVGALDVRFREDLRRPLPGRSQWAGQGSNL